MSKLEEVAVVMEGKVWILAGTNKLHLMGTQRPAHNAI